MQRSNFPEVIDGRLTTERSGDASSLECVGALRSQNEMHVIGRQAPLVEWPEGDEKPLRFWLSTLPAELSFTELVRLTKPRWRIKRDYLDLKQECASSTTRAGASAASTTTSGSRIAAYGLLITQTGAIPPSALRNQLSSREIAGYSNWVKRVVSR